jgi:hypothetical protein
MCVDRPKIYPLGTPAQTAQVCPAGFDGALQAVIDAQHISIITFIYWCLAPLLSGFHESRPNPDREQLRMAFAAFQRSSRPPILPLFLKLTPKRNLTKTTQMTRIRRCLRQGWFCISMRACPDICPNTEIRAAALGTHLSRPNQRASRIIALRDTNRAED